MFKPRKQLRGCANKSNIWAEHSECVGRAIETERVVGLTKNANSRPRGEMIRGWERRRRRGYLRSPPTGAHSIIARQSARGGTMGSDSVTNSESGAPQKKGPRTENGLNVKWRQCRQHGRRLTPRSPPSRQRTTALRAATDNNIR